MIKKIVFVLFLIILIIIFCNSYFYIKNHKNDNFAHLINKEIELKKGKYYEFEYHHSIYNQEINYSPEIQILCPNINDNVTYQYNFDVKVKITRNGKIIISEIYPHKGSYNKLELNWTFFPLSKTYSSIKNDKGDYKLILEVMSSSINIPEGKYKNVLLITIDNIGQYQTIRAKYILNFILLYVSGLMLIVIAIMYLFKKAKIFFINNKKK